MTPRRSVRFALAAALCLASQASATPAAEWDQARVAGLAQDLVGATNELYDSFFKQPRVSGTPNAVRNYERLEREIRHIKRASRGLAGDLKRGETREQTQTAYESVISSVNWARTRARSVFTTQDVNARADHAQQILDQIGKYYETAAPAAVKE